MVVRASQKQDRSGRKITNVKGRNKVAEPHSQSLFTHPHHSSAESLIPSGISVFQAIGKRAADIDITAFENDRVQASDLLCGKANRRRTHRNAQSCSGLLRPALTNKIEDRRYIAMFVVAETRALTSAFSVSSMIESHATVAGRSQESDT